jgi:hypothetical protein
METSCPGKLRIQTDLHATSTPLGLLSSALERCDDLVAVLGHLRPPGIGRKPMMEGKEFREFREFWERDPTEPCMSDADIDGRRSAQTISAQPRSTLACGRQTQHAARPGAVRQSDEPDSLITLDSPLTVDPSKRKSK